MFAKPTPGFTTAAAEGDTVVLLIGMRINHFWAVHHTVPVFFAMLRMLRELAKDPSRGLLGRILLTASPRTYYVVQYWESKEKLYAYAAAPDGFHHTMWGLANRMQRAGKLRGHVGLWHEAYIVPEGSYESIYFDMPPFGLAAATGVLPVESRGRRAADRFAHRSKSPAEPKRPAEPTGPSEPKGASDRPAQDRPKSPSGTA
ncbi:DUF4188 domain-containing protein [Streptomyces sp. NPDC059063]|uniref:DUF4188 domain-containing protein n=1 Tax=unclassified Streptomyces TaxID=2593676 RepID=UPI0036ABCF00